MATISSRVKPLAVYALLALALAYVGRSASRSMTTASRRSERAAFGEVPKHEPNAADYNRALERGRGRNAASPSEIPRAGWMDILWRTYQEMGEDRLTTIAAGVVFFGLLALFPAITAFVSLYGLFADSSSVSRHLALAAGILPTSALDIVKEQIDRIVQTGETVLGFAFVFGLGLALWSANAGMKAIIDALNVIYGEKEKRGFIELTLVALAFTAGALVVMLLAVGAVVVVPILLNTFGLGQVSEMVMTILRWPMLLAVAVVGLAILYRYGPSRTQPRWEWLGIGSVVASVIWLTSSVLLSWYLEKFAHYDATYGSLGAGIGMMMWMWISTIAILFGAELNAEIEHQTALDSTVGRPKPLGDRGAAMADTVGSPAPGNTPPGKLSLQSLVGADRKTAKARRRVKRKRSQKNGATGRQAS